MPALSGDKPLRPKSLPPGATPSSPYSRRPGPTSMSDTTLDWPMPVLPSPTNHTRDGSGAAPRGSVPPSPGSGSHLRISVPTEGSTSQQPHNQLMSFLANSRAVPPLSPSAAAVRAVMLQSPAFARPRNSPTPGPRYSRNGGDSGGGLGPSPGDGSGEYVLPADPSPDLPDGWDERESSGSPGVSAPLVFLTSPRDRSSAGVAPPHRSTASGHETALRLGPSSSSHTLGASGPNASGPRLGGSSSLGRSTAGSTSAGGTSAGGTPSTDLVHRSGGSGSSIPAASAGSFSGHAVHRMGSRGLSVSSSSRPAAPSTKFRSMRIGELEVSDVT